MADFNPSPHDRLTIGGLTYEVMPHPAVPTFAFGQEGRKAFVFQLAGGPDQGLYALKKFKQAFRLPELVEINDKLARFAQWPGLEVCKRECLHDGKHADILNKYPDLEFAVLMPWIGGSTWYDMVIGMTPLSRLEALAYANAVAQVLAALEEAGLAHCDISAANVIINPNTNRAHLIDVEDLYAPSFTAPAARPAGTDGYAHDTVKGGYWGPLADRFSGAVIISEMAAWHVPEIRKQAEDEHYFDPAEMQDDSPRYQLMHRVLDDISPHMAELFDQAWFSTTLADAPPLKAWQEVISEVFQRENVARVAPQWRPLTIPGAQQTAEAPPARPVQQQAEPPAPRQAEAPQPAPPASQPEEEDEAAQAPAAEMPSSPPPAEQPSTPPPSVPRQQPPAQQPSAPPSAPPPSVPQGTTSYPSRSLHVQPSPQTGGPVVEWRPLNLPAAQQPAAQPDAPPASNGVPTTGNRPIMPHVQAEPEQEAEPEPEPEPESEPVMEAELADEAAMEAPAVESYGRAAEEAATDEAYEDEVADKYADEVAVEGDEFTAEVDTARDAVDPLPAEHQDELYYEDEVVEAADEPGEALFEEAEAFEPVDPEPARERAYSAGLLKPLLDLTHIDERNRPHLVWTESPGAETYVLQEDDNPQFDAPKEYSVRANNGTRWSPPPWPLWRRSGRLYYRLRAEAGDDAGPWSDVLQVRIGRG